MPIQTCPAFVPHSPLMWRQTLRAVPTCRGTNVNYTQYVQQHPPPTKLFSHHFLRSDIQKSDFEECKKKHQPKEEELRKEIELVSPKIQRHLFPNVINSDVQPEISDDMLAKISLPELHESVEKNGLMAHFDAIGNEQFSSYEELLNLAAAIEHAPKMPKQWNFTSGWTKYDSQTGISEAVPFPDEKVLFFDVEVCVPESKLACLAVAMSPTSWYSWCSDRLVNGTEIPKYTRLEHMIPLEPPEGTKTPKVVIGHNVGFDRARVREQYYSEKTATRFWDTMSMNIAVFGMAEHQRLIYETTDLKEDFNTTHRWAPAWRSRVSKNSLGAVHAKLCGDSTKLELNKSMQDVFVKENIATIREHFQALTTYCAEDVQATFEVFQKLYPIFRERFPHPITYVGMMEMGSAYLPITESWRQFYDKCNEESSERNNKAAQGLGQASLQIVKELSPSDAYMNDPWMWICDWTEHKKLFKPKWYLNLFKTNEKATQTEDIASTDIKFKCRDVPRVFGICYGPFPLHYKADYGWGYLVPNSDRSREYSDAESVKVRRGDVVSIPNKAIMELIEKNRAQGFPELPLPSVVDAKVGIFDYYRLPHPTKPGQNVGSPFTKDYIDEFEAQLFRATRYSEALTDYLSILRSTRFWSNYKERFQDEITVWFDDEAKIGAIAPAIVPAGTITRRATHKLWLTSTSPKEGVIGTDMKSMVQCTDGWKIVGADVDSQEQWLAALLGDVVTGTGQAGATPFAQMLLAGSKADKSDLHSVVAKQVGISRDHAKVLNYARLYGAGKPHAIQFLKQNAIDENSAKAFSDKLFSTTKGIDRMYYELNPELTNDFKEFLEKECPPKYRNQHIVHQGRIFLQTYTHTDGQQSYLFEDYMKIKDGNESRSSISLSNYVVFLVKLYPNFPQKVSLFKDGFESDTFNFLEIKALEDSPKTPILGCRLSQALEALPKDVPDADLFRQRYKRTVINWVIQSTAVDFLHMLLVCMKWLCDKYEIKARFVLSIHDEIRYLVADEDKYRCALALTLSNMYVRAAISQKLGINQLPKSVAFFSQVDIDTVLRKEVDQKCTTPDGRSVPPGDALDMKQIIEKTGGTLEKQTSSSPLPSSTV